MYPPYKLLKIMKDYLNKENNSILDVREVFLNSPQGELCSERRAFSFSTFIASYYVAQFDRCSGH